MRENGIARKNFKVIHSGSSVEGKEKVLHSFFDIFFWEKLRLNWDFLRE